MGEFIAKALDAFVLASVHAVGLDVGAPSVLFAALARPELFRSLIVGAWGRDVPARGRGHPQVDDRSGSAADAQRRRSHRRVPASVRAAELPPPPPPTAPATS